MSEAERLKREQLLLREDDRVQKITGDYNFKGTIVAAFRKMNGQRRLVVENHDGILHIFSPSNLRLEP